MRDESKHTEDSGTTTLVEEERGERADSNRDPITGEPGAHPVGTGVGAVTGAAAGAAVGAAGGPVGAVVGGAVGAVVGGLAGHGVAEQVNPSAPGSVAAGGEGVLGTPAVVVYEAEYWRETWPTRPYAGRDLSFEDYEPAYRYGWESRSRQPERAWDAGLESDLESGWERAKGRSRLTWERAKIGVKDAWDRFERKLRR